MCHFRIYVYFVLRNCNQIDKLAIVTKLFMSPLVRLSPEVSLQLSLAAGGRDCYPHYNIKHKDKENSSINFPFIFL